MEDKVVEFMKDKGIYIGLTCGTIAFGFINHLKGRPVVENVMVSVSTLLIIFLLLYLIRWFRGRKVHKDKGMVDKVLKEDKKFHRDINEELKKIIDNNPNEVKEDDK